MAIHFRASRELGLCVVEFEGVVTAEEFERLLDPLVDDPVYTTMPMTLVDTTEALRVAAPSEVVRRFARRIEAHVDEHVEGLSRLALVATRAEFFGLSRMYEMLRGQSPVEMQVFRSLEAAEAWLGLPENYDKQLDTLF